MTALRPRILFAAVPLLLALACRDKDSASGPAAPGAGLAIYAANVAFTTDDSYQHFGLDTVTLSDTPLIAYHDILAYDTANHVLALSFTRDSIRVGHIDLRGSAFVVTLDDDRLYGGFFWTYMSSFLCDVPIIQLDTMCDSLQFNQIEIERDYMIPDTATGPDPRRNAALFARLVADGKAR